MLLRNVSLKFRILILMIFVTLVSSSFAQVEANLSVSIVSDFTIIPIGTNFTYTITVENLGLDDATFVTVTDNLPSEIIFLTSSDCGVSDSIVSCSIGNIISGESVNISYQMKAVSDGSATNSVTVMGAETDPDVSDNNISTSVSIIIPEPVDITLSGSSSSPQVDIGDIIDVNFIVDNNDVVPSYLTLIELVLPSQVQFNSSSDCSNAGSVVTCAIGTIVTGDPKEVSLSLLATAPGNSVNISALVSHIESDSDASNNGVSLTIIVNEPPPESSNLQLGMIPLSSQFIVGEPVHFNLTVINSGPSDATQVRIIIDLPDDLELDSSSDCAVAGEFIVCNIGNLVLNAVYTGSLNLRSPISSSAITISGNVMGHELDPNIYNNLTSVTMPSLNPIAIEATITPTLTPVIVTVTPGPTQTPDILIVTQPVFLTEVANFVGDNIGDVGIDLLPDGIAPSDIYGWSRYESVDLIPVTGHWLLRTAQNASDGAYHESRDSGAMLRFPFEGDGFRVGYRSDVHGSSFQILLDGEFLALYATDFTQIDPDLNPVRQTFITQPHWVTPGYHVVDIVCISEAQGGCNVDYIEVFTGPPVPIAPATLTVSTQSLVIENVELISAPPTLAPTGTPLSDSVIAVDVFIIIDLNTNKQIEPNEGVSGMTVQAMDVSNNTTLATSSTDDSGFLRISVATSNDVVILIPMLGESFYVRNRGSNLTDTWTLMLDPATIPGLIP